MMRFDRMIAAAVLGMLLVAPAAALAGDAGGTSVTEPRRERRDERRDRVLERIEVLRTARLTQALDLDTAAADKLFPVLHRFAEKRNGAVKQRWSALRGLSAQLRSEQPDPGQVSRLLDQVVEAKKAYDSAGVEEFQALRGVLDPVRLARYYKAQIEFERDLRRWVGEARGGRGGERGERMRERMRERLREGE